MAYPGIDVFGGKQLMANGDQCSQGLGLAENYSQQAPGCWLPSARERILVTALSFPTIIFCLSCSCCSSICCFSRSSSLAFSTINLNCSSLMDGLPSHSCITWWAKIAVECSLPEVVIMVSIIISMWLHSLEAHRPSWGVDQTPHLTPGTCASWPHASPQSSAVRFPAFSVVKTIWKVCQWCWYHCVVWAAMYFW